MTDSKPETPTTALESGDRAVTTVCNDGSFRVIAVRSTQTVQQVLDWQAAKGLSGKNLADLVTATVLVRLTMAPTLRVQCMVRGAAGHGTLVADSHPDGTARGLLRETAGAIEVGPGSLVQVMRSLPNGTIQQGVVEVSGEGFGISGAVTTYMQESEQVTAIVGAGCVIEDGRVAVAGGWIVQLLPECTEPPLAVITERMNVDFADAEAVLRAAGGDPLKLQEEILYGIEYTQTADVALSGGCHCSSERVLASMATLGQEELEDIIAKGETLDVSCDYCQRAYQLSPESLRGLLSAS